MFAETLFPPSTASQSFVELRQARPLNSPYGVLRGGRGSNVTANDRTPQKPQSAFLRFVTFIFVLFGLAPSVIAAPPDSTIVLQDVRRLLKNKPGLPLDVRTQADQLAQYYGQRDAKILWLKSDRNLELVSAFAGLTAIGVTNMDAALARISLRKQALNSEDASILALVELTFSATLIEAAQKLRLGQMHLYRESLHPRTLQRFIYGDRLLALAASGEPITSLLNRIEPQTADYQAIRQKLIQYVAVQKNGGWPEITKGPDLKRGDLGPRVADLRQRLQTTGYLPPSATLSDAFDEALAEALRTFQRQHAISATGILDRRTLLTLNVPVADRIAQLAVNLERWRWFEDITPGAVWIINTNAARLERRGRNRSPQIDGLKVDGACEQLPAFDSTIEHVDFGPEYSLPPAIAGRYILPVLQNNPESLNPSLTIYAGRAYQGVSKIDWKTYSETNFPFKVTQSAGPTNLLGGFRFRLKDDAGVSIHGRPSSDPDLPVPRNLWPSCVAIAGGSEVVTSLMSEAGVALSAAADVMTTSRRVDITAPIPVIILYASVWLDLSGGVVFGPDTLGRDQRLLRKLTATPSS